MTKKALLITGQESETISTLARNLIHVGGLSLFTRQMKQMATLGVEEMHIVTDWFSRDFEKEIQNCSPRPEKMYIHSTKDAPINLIEHNHNNDIWFLLEEGVILDDRIIDLVAQNVSPTVISFIGHNEFLEERTANGLPLQLNEQEGYFGSIAKLSSQTLSAAVRKLSTLEGLQNALKAISRAEDCDIMRLVDIPLYQSSHHRNVDLVWIPLTRREDADKGTDTLLEQSQKGALSWPSRFIYNPLEKLVIKYICKLLISADQITLFTGLLSLSLIYLFWSGLLMPALLGSFLVGFLYSVKDKLSHIKRQAIKIRNIDYPFTKVVEYCWYAALALYLSKTYGNAVPIMAAGLVLFNIADVIQRRFFHRMSNAKLYDMGTFDRKFRLIAGDRHTFFWTLLPFALFNQWFIGFSVICAYGVITFFVHQVRVVYHLKNLMMAQSETFAENFKKTKIL